MINIKLVSPEATWSIILSLRDWKINAATIISISPKNALIIAKIGVLPIFALTILSKFSETSPEIISSVNSSISLFSSSISFSEGVLIIKS